LGGLLDHYLLHCYRTTCRSPLEMFSSWFEGHMFKIPPMEFVSNIMLI